MKGLSKFKLFILIICFVFFFNPLSGQAHTDPKFNYIRNTLNDYLNDYIEEDEQAAGSIQRLIDNEEDMKSIYNSLLEESKNTNKGLSVLSSNDSIWEVEPNDYFDYADVVYLDYYVYGILDDYYDVDCFKLTIHKPGIINILGLLGYSGIFSDYFIIGLWDSNENILSVSQPFSNSQVLTEYLMPGTYYIVVILDWYGGYITNELYVFKTWMDEVGVGWNQIDDNWYYIDEDGWIVTGWHKICGRWYYFDEDGIMQTGWIETSGNWYYLSSSGAMVTGWNKISGKWYYFNNNGVMQTSWLKSGSNWYYLTSSGAMATGWQKVGGKWYYFNKNGIMQTGWLKSGSNWYYLTSSGAMATGWRKIGSKWYYFSDSGIMQTGWVKYGGRWYYLYSDGSMAANTTIGGYRLGKDGAWIN
jgi:glucan-binding YG repeat protein